MEVVAGLINYIPLLLKVKPCGLSAPAFDKNKEGKWSVLYVHEPVMKRKKAFWYEIHRKWYLVQNDKFASGLGAKNTEKDL